MIGTKVVEERDIKKESVLRGKKQLISSYNDNFDGLFVLVNHSVGNIVSFTLQSKAAIVWLWQGSTVASESVRNINKNSCYRDYQISTSYLCSFCSSFPHCLLINHPMIIFRFGYCSSHITGTRKR